MAHPLRTAKRRIFELEKARCKNAARFKFAINHEFSADSVKSAEAVGADPSPQLGFRFADVISARSALEKVVKKVEFRRIFAVKFFHKNIM